MAGFASKEQAVKVLEKLVSLLSADEGVKENSKGTELTVAFEMTDYEIAVNLSFNDGVVGGSVGAVNEDAMVRLTMTSEIFDGMMTGEVDGNAAAMSGDLVFSGDMMAAMSMQGIMPDFGRLYAAAKA
jgi:putative sterol carrier protein